MPYVWFYWIEKDSNVSRVECIAKGLIAYGFFLWCDSIRNGRVWLLITQFFDVEMFEQQVSDIHEPPDARTSYPLGSHCNICHLMQSNLLRRQLMANLYSPKQCWRVPVTGIFTMGERRETGELAEITHVVEVNSPVFFWCIRSSVLS